MTKNVLGKLVLSALVASAYLPVIAPEASAMDYEAKPVSWVLQAPVRTVGAVSGALFSGAVSGPIDDGYHWFLKGTNHVAEKFGDEHGWGQRAAAVPIGGSTGLVLGSAHGVYSGFFHGWKKGWEKPFSRWSFITMEEK
ncbi:MAG: hypothetical protein IPP57_05575 [Candidatus Obscuribacter sp.]|jgi:ABC-type dipeptide/oligopeptide/nickel transport system permease subunit|nr:hypothetical protein [Candidatus Obscuribacter sp.]MDQ5965566.1 hypothetical protein [Cyanobacteriota bacterium erpe_2018_sw_39hr_WHONDRS-SW48-000098_B_bin.30]MBK7837316.1 hypothetical protein [Candidatus Obscuribacter sp.]MBK9206140.1 hypothetical protein [Candidatus Obscuribacter sp.]MBK9618055.1 hypothetical protein [Candidatus Obscuribacter sp.]